MKKLLLASILFALSTSAFAEVNIVATDIEVRNPATQRMDKLSAQDVINPDKVMAYLPPVEGSQELYKAYVANGYIPFHALLLTTWDVTEGMRIVAPNLPENPQMKARIVALRKQYQPAN